MSDPQATKPQATAPNQALDNFITDTGIKLQLDPTDSRIEELRYYQHWTLIDLDALAGITQFSHIMCADEWLEKMLQVEVSDLTKVLYLYGLEALTVSELLLYVGVPADLLLEATVERTIAEFSQTALNAFRLQQSYQDDPSATGKDIEQLCEFADVRKLELVEPRSLVQAAIALRATLAAKGYQSAVLNLSIPLGADTAATRAYQVVRTPIELYLKELPQADRSVVLRLDDEDPDIDIGGLDAYQMQALTIAINDRTQAMLADSKESAATATLRQLISRVWSTYLLSYEDYQTMLADHKGEHSQALQPLVGHLTEVLRELLRQLILDFSEVPMTLTLHVLRTLSSYFGEQLHSSVYPHRRAAASRIVAARLFNLQEPKMFYLICYDITNDRRRDRVSRLLEGYGMRVQKSVFECVLTPDQYALLQKRFQTKRYLNPNEDQIRFYPLAPRHRKMVLLLGMQPLRQVDDTVFIA